MIARRWRGRTRAADFDAYLTYLEGSGIEALRTTAGNAGVVVFRHLDESTDSAEFEVVSYWHDLADIKVFAGGDINVARFFPDDDRYLIDRDLAVRHDLVDTYPAGG